MASSSDDDIIMFIKKGNIAHRLGQFERASKEYQRAANIETSQATDQRRTKLRGTKFWWYFARVLSKLQQTSRAADAYKKATALLAAGYAVDKAHLVYIELASCLIQMDEQEEAVQNLTHSLDLKRTFKGLCKRGQLHVVMGLYETAILDLSNALKMKPLHTKTLSTRAIAYQSSQNYVFAKQDLEACLQQKILDVGKRVQLNVQLGWCLLELKHFGNAVGAFECAKLLQPENAEAIEGLKRALTYFDESKIALEDSLLTSGDDDDKVNKTAMTMILVNKNEDGDDDDKQAGTPADEAVDEAVKVEERVEVEEEDLVDVLQENEDSSMGVWHTITPGTRKQHHFEPEILTIPAATENKATEHNNTIAAQLSSNSSSNISASDSDLSSEDDETSQNTVLAQWRQTLSAVSLRRRQSTKQDGKEDKEESKQEGAQHNEDPATTTPTNMEDRYELMEKRLNQMDNTNSNTNTTTASPPQESLPQVQKELTSTSPLHRKTRLLRIELRMDKIEARWDKFETRLRRLERGNHVEELTDEHKMLVKQLVKNNIFQRKK